MAGAKYKRILAVCLLFGACAGGLPPGTKREIAAESGRLGDARRQVEGSQAAVSKDLASDPQLFGSSGGGVPDGWRASLRGASEELGEAARVDRSLEDLARRNRADSQGQADRLLEQERRLRVSAVSQAKGVAGEADKWVAFKASLPAKLAGMQREYGSVHERSFGPAAELVGKAEADWPAKKAALESRLDSLKEIPREADKVWADSAAARQEASSGQAGGAAVATLIQTEEALARDDARLSGGLDELRSLSGQLYDSWDKILTDLDASKFENDRLYRERIKTVRTHLTDPAEKHGTTTSSEQWVTVSEPAFRTVERNIGMAIGHKDAGLFDYEAQTTPQPAGFAYIATEEQGRNQYGYWGRDGGGSVWHWLPEYLILRELLWNHDYRPVVLGEYRGYQTARSSGRTYYGQTTPSSPPKYGTGGTFTATHYAGSKYAQAGGFRGSAYASDRANHSPSFESGHAQSQPGSFARSDGSGGKRFGAGASAPSGRRFGQSHSFPSAGRSFGRHR